MARGIVVGGLAPGGFEAQLEGVAGAVAVAGAQGAVLLGELALEAPLRRAEIEPLPAVQRRAALARAPQAGMRRRPPTG